MNSIPLMVQKVVKNNSKFLNGKTLNNNCNLYRNNLNALNVLNGSKKNQKIRAKNLSVIRSYNLTNKTNH